MSLLTTQDLLFFIAAFCILIVTGFIAWALYEIARLIHQTNSIVNDARQKVESLGEHFSSLTKYLGLILTGGKQAMSYMQKRQQKKRNRREVEPMEEEE